MDGKREWTKSKGFTLIELLIVVAIIAILAAIAVPNFLEAQTRAKVSRAKSDQRSLATAIESYSVDNNRPPLGVEEINTNAGAVIPASVTPYDIKNEWMWSFLTTPIAYMTAIPKDPFISKGFVNQKGNPNNSAVGQYFTYQATVRENPINSTNLLGWEHRKCKELGVSWFLSGLGPSRRQAAKSGEKAFPVRGIARIPSGDYSSIDFTPQGFVYGYPDVFYDPTNGTVSFGFIARSSRGVEPTGN